MKARTLLFRSVSYLFLFLLGIIFSAVLHCVFAGSFKSYQEIFLNVFGLPADYLLKITEMRGTSWI